MELVGSLKHWCPYSKPQGATSCMIIIITLCHQTLALVDIQCAEIDDETLKEVLAADSELDEYSEESDEDNGSGYK